MTTKAKSPDRSGGVRPGKKLSAYLRLVAEHPLVSIRSESQLNAAQKVVDRLLAKDSLDAGEEMYLDALSDLVSAHEDVHYPIETASDGDLLQHLMDAKGVSQAELHRQTGIPKSTISEILSGKKPFSRTLIRTLADYFRVSTNVLAANL
jgi:HTH-type transcriptional regulator / antitoxin HigA